jgi:CRISPR/Cas system-associated endoribonuclease Cas2
MAFDSTVSDPKAVDVDPVTFEVIKHRLWQINDEQSIAMHDHVLTHKKCSIRNIYGRKQPEGRDKAQEP